MSVDSIEYKHVLERGNEVFALYYPKGTNNDNQSIEAEAIAYFSFKKKSIVDVYIGIE